MQKQLKLNLLRIQALFRKHVAKLKFSASDLFVKMALLFVILVLGYNIYISYNKGVKNLARIAGEEEKLKSLITENQRLDELEKYYASAEFGLAYARDSWSLGEAGSTLFFVNREPQQQVENLKDELNPIPVNDHQLWWKKLILGI